METMDLRLALLRGASGNQLQFDTSGRMAPVRMQVQQKTGLSDRLTLNVLNLIASGSLPGGTMLPAERRIAGAIQTSRVSVRAALLRLKTDGYLTALQGAGTQVTDRREVLERVGAASRSNFIELSEFVAFFDALLLERAIEGGAPLDLGRAFADLLQAQAQTGGCPFAEYEFRLRLAELAGGSIFGRIITVLKRGLISYFSTAVSFVPGSANAARQVQCETALMAGLLSGRVPEAREALDTRNQLQKYCILSRSAEDCSPPRPFEEADVLRHLALEQPEQLRDAVAREIAMMISTGQFTEGGTLLSERRFSDLFGVSRATVQEALAQLKAMELLPASSGPRTRAQAPGADQVAKPSITARDLLDLNHIRAFLESWSAAEAAQRMDSAGERSIRRIIAEMRRPILSQTRDMNLDLMFHLTIGTLSQNALTLYVSEALRTVVLSYFHAALSNPGFPRRPGAQLLAEHEAIGVALLERDAQAARAAMNAHVKGFRAHYQRFTQV